MAASAHENNYLNHTDLAEFRGELADCKVRNGGNCPQDTLNQITEKYATISFKRDVTLARCIADPSCDHSGLISETVYNDQTAMGEANLLLNEVEYIPAVVEQMIFPNPVVVDTYKQSFQEEFRWKSSHCARPSSDACSAQYAEMSLDRANNILNASSAISLIMGGGAAINVVLSRGLGKQLVSSCSRHIICKASLLTINAASTAADIAECTGGNAVACGTLLVPGPSGVRITKGPKSNNLDKINGGATNNVTEASVQDKLERYLLNVDHPVGGSKATWFQQALGFNKTNISDLAVQIKFDPKTAVQTTTTEFGTKFNQVIPIIGANGKTIDVTFGWIQNGAGEIKLVTGIPTSK